MNKTCNRCGASFSGHFNAKFCGDSCRKFHFREYRKEWKAAIPKIQKQTPVYEPFPPDIERNGFGYWLSGFIDGEATFQLRKNKIRNGKENRLAFIRISLRADDAPVLGLIQSYWQCGNIVYSDNSRSRIPNAKPVMSYAVASIRDLKFIVLPHLEQFQMFAKKKNDFAIWRKGVDLAWSIQSREKVPRFEKGGFHPVWSSADKELFDSLSAELASQRTFSVIPD